jgi:hypothetical protein
MKNRYCFWSVSDGHYARMIENMIRSARAVGVFKDFHVWANRSIEGATTHQLGKIEKSFHMFKFRLLRQKVKSLNYEYFVWLDADSWFAKNPGDVLRVLNHAPVHASLESDACNPKSSHRKWWGCPLQKCAELMRTRGVHNKSIFTANAGFWIVHHDVINTFCDLAAEFWVYSHKQGCNEFREEPALAHATQMLCGNPYLHTLRKTSDLWAPDRAGEFRTSLPDGTPWNYEDAFTHERFAVNPAIVHAMKSKSLLAGRPLGRRLAKRN